MPLTLETLENGAVRCLEDPGEPGYRVLSRRVSVTPAEQGILRAMAAGRVVIEIGTGLGVSARAMASTAMRLTTVDCDPWVHKHVWPLLPSSVRALSSLEHCCWPADLAFIDGLHTAEAVERDVRSVLPLMDRRVASGILFHDIQLVVVRETVLRLFGRMDEIAPNLGWVLTAEAL